MMPGLVAGALLAFTLSLDDFVITFFTSGPETVTFPVKVYSLVRRGVSPEINAASTVLIVITVVATILAMKLQAPGKTGQRVRAMTEPIVSIRNVTKTFRRRCRCRRRCLLRHRAERVLRAARPFGLRQDHAAAHDLRPRNADRGPDRHRRRGHGADAAQQAPGQHGVPVLCRLPAHDGARQCRLWPEGHGRAARGDRASARRKRSTW